MKITLNGEAHDIAEALTLEQLLEASDLGGKRMQSGCDDVLMNTAIAAARDPALMAHAMNLAIQAGRAALRAGRISRKRYASASSPIDGTIG